MKKLITHVAMSFGLLISFQTVYSIDSEEINKGIERMQALFKELNISVPNKEDVTVRDINDAVRKIISIEGDLYSGELSKVVVGALLDQKVDDNKILPSTGLNLWRNAMDLQIDHQKELHQRKLDAEKSFDMQDFVNLALENPVITGAVVTSLLTIAGAYAYKYYMRDSKKNVTVDSENNKNVRS